MTNLVAGIMAGTLEAILVVAPVETVKTRLVDADQVRAVGVSRKGGDRSRGGSSGSGSSSSSRWWWWWWWWWQK